MSVVHLQVLHVAAVSYQVPETVVREPPVKLGLYHKLAGTPRPVLHTRETQESARRSLTFVTCEKT